METKLNTLAPGASGAVDPTAVISFVLLYALGAVYNRIA